MCLIKNPHDWLLLCKYIIAEFGQFQGKLPIANGKKHHWKIHEHISTAIARVTWPSLNYYQSPKSMIKVAKEFLESTQDDIYYYKKL